MSCGAPQDDTDAPARTYYVGPENPRHDLPREEVQRLRDAMFGNLQHVQGPWSKLHRELGRLHKHREGTMTNPAQIAVLESLEAGNSVRWRALDACYPLYREWLRLRDAGASPQD